jgi:hypothetical protein
LHFNFDYTKGWLSLHVWITSTSKFILKYHFNF